jgi:hypothetical protein
MRSKESLNAPEALVLTMVLVSVADGGITDREIGIMAGEVQTLPVFLDFSAGQFDSVTEAAVQLLNEEDGLAHAGRLIRNALSPKLRETAYALACEVIAGGLEGSTRSGSHGQALDMLAFVRETLGLDHLIATAIERGVRARYYQADPGG